MLRFVPTTEGVALTSGDAPQNGKFKRDRRSEDRPLQKRFWLAGRENGALGRGVARHGRDFFQIEAGDEHGSGGNAAPAIQFALGTDEFDFCAQGEVENNLGGATIELLRELQEWLFAEVLSVGGTPDGDVERFLFDLVGDLEEAEESAGSA